MGKTKRGEKPPGWETWSKRPYSCAPPGRISKKITSGKERMESKKIVKKAKEEDADYVRIPACIIWLLCGLAQRDILGYMSAVASAMFLYAIYLESK